MYHQTKDAVERGSLSQVFLGASQTPAAQCLLLHQQTAGRSHFSPFVRAVLTGFSSRSVARHTRLKTDGGLSPQKTLTAPGLDRVRQGDATPGLRISLGQQFWGSVVSLGSPCSSGTQHSRNKVSTRCREKIRVSKTPYGRRNKMIGRPVRSLEQRLLSRCEQITESGCWIWHGSLSHNGYGFIGTGVGSQTRRVHRIAYELYRGKIPNGYQLDHLCRVRCCANPWHCEIVTAQENVLRGIGPTAMNAKKTHCKNGHKLERLNGCRRACLICL